MSNERCFYDVEANLYNWLTNIGGLEVVAEYAKYLSPEIENSFISYSTLAPIIKGTSELVYKSNDDFTIKAIVTIPVEVRVYSSNALKKALDLQLSLDRPSVRETYFSGLGFLNDATLQDISASMDTGYETRALLRFNLTKGIEVDDTIGYINSVTGEIIIKDLLDVVEYQQDIEINLGD